ncbi:putative mycofactocin biosynthesis glycosyltransferase MftF [Mycobacterium kansasii]|uniref:Putative mycofactocin biosynthesis glycosyltransferase MftF n=1 Tax=Mycobacterium kansasii TaxID=1768 RepID=A0A7G1IJB3_MYCKA|nr:putative mycofactocin biosynthesis glycosyltransferase MftF [Mycobacterium kansasii]
MTQTRLPDGFAVQVDRRVRVLGDGSALLGGSPTRLLRLAPAAQDMLSDGRLKVRDELTAQLARTLLDATVAHPRPASGPSYRDVTVVIPVRDNTSGVRRLVASLRGLRVIVVDDGSACPVELEDFPGRTATSRCCITREARVLPRHVTPVWPPAPPTSSHSWIPTWRPAGMARSAARPLLRSHRRPGRTRIVGMAQSENLVARYEAVRSSLDLGLREAPVLPHSPVSYVPSAAIICRAATLRDVGGFDETLHSGEDVDLCWRLIEGGARLRYEPIALVAHDHRTQLRDWIARKAFYGGSAAPLSVRHPDKTAPLVISGWALTAWILMSLGTGLCRLASLVIAVATGRRIARTMRSADTTLWDVLVVATRGLWSAALQLASAMCRHYWPVTLIAALLFRRCRRVVLVAAIVDGVVDWLRRKEARDGDDGDSEPIGVLTYVILKRVDDLAYGLGLWYGVVRERNIGALKPQIRA